MTSPEFVLSRIERLLTTRIRSAIHSERITVEMEAWPVDGDPVGLEVASRQHFQPFSIGSSWGAAWQTWWFSLRAPLPASWQDRTVELIVDPGFQHDWPGGQAEGLLYTRDGKILKAINPRNNTWRLPAGATGLDLWFEASAIPDVMDNGFTPTDRGDRLTASSDHVYTFKTADLALFDATAWELYFDVEVAWQLAKELLDTEPRKHKLLRALSRAADVLDLRGVAAGAHDAREALADVLAAPAHASAHWLSAVGHAHIDCAWLWPVQETVRKASRTFSNVLDLAEQYPEFRFACSSAVQYAWVEETNPDLFARIKQAVADGLWFPVGGMWVEPDGNLPSGESLVRQLTHGQRYFIDRFGQPSTGMWIPDSFGYTAAYPQLAKLAGMEWFLTQKISWNQTNQFPHHTFWWEGLDGTQLYTHFAPVDNYVSTLEGHELAHAVRNFTEHGGSSTSLVPFGYGDGGGGPVRDMMERYRRVRNLEGSPRVTIENPHDFFMRQRAEYPDAPVWVGELYLELHRGTFTSQAPIKRGNRRVESLLHTAEFLWTTAMVRAGVPYPTQELDGWWKRLLLNQFHDILPGSSIAWAHRDAQAELSALTEEINASIGQALAAFPPHEPSVLNAAPVIRREVVVIDGQPRLVEVAPYASAPATAITPQHPIRVDGDRVTNDIVSFTFADDMTLNSIIDEISGRELLAAGEHGNVLRIHPDYPNSWDAWDVDAHYRNIHETITDVTECVVEESTELCHRVRIVRRFRQSTFTQWVALAADDNRITVHTTVDWHERERILKQRWGLGVRTDQSQAEIQFGHIHRPTHTNTSWQEAAFELYAHRWVRFAEPGFGVALTTDSTYGYDTQRFVDDDGEVGVAASLSLLRAPNFPDPQSDRGVHDMACAILVAPTTQDAITAGYRMNSPVLVTSAAVGEPFVNVEGGYLETIKASDDDPRNVIIRVYEGLGARTDSAITSSFDCAWEVVDLLERPMEARGRLAVEGRTLSYELHPFEVITLKLRRNA